MEKSVKLEKRVKSEENKKNEDPDSESSPPRKRPKRSSSGKHLTVRIESQRTLSKDDWKDILGVLAPPRREPSPTPNKGKLRALVASILRSVTRVSPPGHTIPQRFPWEGTNFAPVSSPDPRYSLPEAVARLELEKQEYRRQRALAVQEEELRRNTFRPPPTGVLLPGETLNDDIPIFRDVQPPLEKDGPVAKALEEEFPFL